MTAAAPDQARPGRAQPGPPPRGLADRLFAPLYRTIWFHWALVGPVLAWRYWRIVGRRPRLRDPRGMNEKVLARLLFDRRPHIPIFAGKYESRAYVRAATGDESLLIDMVGLARDAAGLRALDLPQRFVVKASHMSGLTRIYDGTTPPDLDELGRIVESWCARVGRLEWGYKPTRHVAIVEHLVQDSGRIPADYKFFCYDGRARFIQVDGDRFGGHRRDYFDRDWQPLDVVVSYPRHDTPPPRPALLERMIAVAEQLSEGVDFVRVDLYAVGEQVKFGELTNYPGGSKEPFRPHDFDAVFGAPWTPTPRHTPPVLALRTARAREILAREATQPDHAIR